MLVVAILELIAPTGPLTALAALAAAGVHGLRLSGWRGERVMNQPILWVLHIGYGWLVIGLALKGLAALAPAAVPPTVALHALTAGAIGTLTLGMMTRVGLGHTGRMLEVSRPIAISYLLIILAAVLRTAGPLLAPEITDRVMRTSGMLWLVAFGVFFVTYLPILTSPRPDGRPG
ncbi:conserved membrane hypothetical protein [uncultured Gammaproteobacteria bacterium]